jgi:hypothetical protein
MFSDKSQTNHESACEKVVRDVILSMEEVLDGFTAPAFHLDFICVAAQMKFFSALFAETFTLALLLPNQRG